MASVLDLAIFSHTNHQGESNKIERIVDITDDCEKIDKDTRCALVFSKYPSTGIRIVTICTSSINNSGDDSFGAFVSFPFNSLDFHMNDDPEPVFESRAKMVGLTKEELYVLIKKHVPV
jgi:hypothetical protein